MDSVFCFVYLQKKCFALGIPICYFNQELDAADVPEGARSDPLGLGV